MGAAEDDALLEAVFGVAFSSDVPVGARMWMSPLDYAALRRQGRLLLELEMMAARIRRGRMGALKGDPWSAVTRDVWVSPSMPRGRVLMLEEEREQAEVTPEFILTHASRMRELFPGVVTGA